MKVSEIKGEINQLKSAGTLKEQTVEIVLGIKKHFLKDFSYSGKELALVVDRNSYEKTPNNKMLSILESADDNAIVTVTEDASKEGKPVTKVFCGYDFLEILAE